MPIPDNPVIITIRRPNLSLIFPQTGANKSIAKAPHEIITPIWLGIICALVEIADKIGIVTYIPKYDTSVAKKSLFFMANSPHANFFHQLTFYTQQLSFSAPRGQE